MIIVIIGKEGNKKATREPTDLQVNVLGVFVERDTAKVLGVGKGVVRNVQEMKSLLDCNLQKHGIIVSHDS